LSQQQESIIGVLKTIRFQGDNGFIIGIFQTQDKKKRVSTTTCGLGNILNPELGLAYKLFGSWETHSQFGTQFKFQFYEVMQPNDTKGIYQYLVRVCKWVGPTVAGRIVEKYKDKSLDILKANPAKVAHDIQGLTEKRAFEIQSNLKENEHIESVLVELEQIFAPISGIRKSLPMELIAIWKSDTVIKLKENPYLITRVKGVGFPTADKIALHLGFDRKSTAREKAAVWHVINENMLVHGSVWIEHEDVCRAVKELTGLSGNDGLIRLMKDQTIVREDAYWATAEIAGNERYIAQKIARMV
jgi:exodeoxyribonuclease V alpha subunit